MRHLPAFTLVESIVVVVMLGIIISPLLINIPAVLTRYTLNRASDGVANIIRQAHIYSRENRPTQSDHLPRVWYVKRPPGNPLRLELYSYEPTTANSKLESTLILDSDINLTEFEIWFTRNTGYLDTSKTVIAGSVPPPYFITIGKSGSTTQIDISEFGNIQVVHL
jgi:type II secretory pathway pseudopilin PulG